MSSDLLFMHASQHVNRAKYFRAEGCHKQPEVHVAYLAYPRSLSMESRGSPMQLAKLAHHQPIELVRVTDDAGFMQPHRLARRFTGCHLEFSSD